ncbi:hypothetical protein RR42_s2364 [Cupriavidus basilensis]|uniref:Uncharacterized protein n=1 Tax=Cupriavidus basilensis TaxID=68895 RepID=A0A0C4YTF3_9BURK|nr:hypothetical protein RR42_s2364 [Cupriavidus basilensis]
MAWLTQAPLASLPMPPTRKRAAACVRLDYAKARRTIPSFRAD